MEQCVKMHPICSSTYNRLSNTLTVPQENRESKELCFDSVLVTIKVIMMIINYVVTLIKVKICRSSKIHLSWNTWLTCKGQIYYAKSVSYIKSKLLEIDHGMRQSFIKHVVSQQTPDSTWQYLTAHLCHYSDQIIMIKLLASSSYHMFGLRKEHLSYPDVS